ncbi:DsbA family protein [Sandarakinorhabdus sp. DWP1-3-1]|uniref:DsbA family protein n=1 Tax=Sandarakinorhabdus sp. DWP1-3-1 TaxID=2804627 RepID=UPI003CEF6839
MTMADARAKLAKIMETRVRAIWLAAAVVLAGAGGAVLAAPGAGGPADKAAIEKIVRDYILAHPEIIPEAMSRLQNREVSALLKSNRAAIETPFAGAVAGNPQGDVSVVVFFDYACPYCRQGHADTLKLAAADKGVRIVYRDFPVLSPASDEAAMASLSAAQQGKYSRFHNAMFDNPGKVSHERTVAMVRTAGLDELRTAKDLGAPALKAEIKRNLELGRALGLTGTPSYVVGDRILSGAVGFDALQAAVAEARQARKEGAAG